MNRGNQLTIFLAMNNETDEKGRMVGTRTVGLISCEVCGAAIILDPEDATNQIERHNDWHDTIDGNINDAARWRPAPRYR